MKAKELKKGQRVKLARGWEADIMSAPGTHATCLAMVYGIFAEAGSVYTADIKSALVDGEWVEVEPSETQLKARLMNDSIFGGL